MVVTLQSGGLVDFLTKAQAVAQLAAAIEPGLGRRRVLVLRLCGQSGFGGRQGVLVGDAVRRAPDVLQNLLVNVHLRRRAGQAVCLVAAERMRICCLILTGLTQSRHICVAAALRGRDALRVGTSIVILALTLVTSAPFWGVVDSRIRHD